MALIEIKDVTKTFKGLILFQDMNFNVEEGKIYGIIGPNGSGKTVLFKMICGFIFPDQGSIMVEGIELGKNKRFPDNFGIIIERPGYIGNLSGIENLMSLASIQGKVSEKDIRKTMELIGLQPNNKRKVKDFSLGMKQKLAIAQAIMENQKILILDEPFNALDSESVTNIRNLLIKFREEGKTILLTSHNELDIKVLCDKVYRINNQTLEEVVMN
jgi:ABC-2 type transport system ATP-binding protein